MTPTERPGGKISRNLWLWLLPFAAGLTVAGVTKLCFPFDGLYGQDAFAYWRYARALWPHVREGTPLPDLYWPVGYPATVALLLPLVGDTSAAGQVVNALACAWTAGATSLLVREFGRWQGEVLRDDLPAVMAGVAVATSGAVLRSSQVVMADGLALGATAAALVCAARHVETRRGEWLVGCALTLAWGFAARWLVGLLALPLGAFLAIHWWRGERGPNLGTRVQRLWAWTVAAVVLAVVVLVPVLLVARAVPRSLAEHEWLVGWSLRNGLSRDFHTPEGHAVYRLPVALFYLVRLGWPDYFFPAYVPCAFLGAWSLLRDQRWSWAALLLGWPVTVWFFLSGIPYENPRFMLPTLPAIGALVGIGFTWIRSATPARLRWVSTLAFLAALSSGTWFGAREHARLVERKNNDRDLVAWALKRLPPDAKLLIAGPSLAFEYYGSMPTIELFSASDFEITALVSRGGSLFLLANVDELENGWTGLPPQRHLEALRKRPGLAVVGTHVPYTLFRVGTDE